MRASVNSSVSTGGKKPESGTDNKKHHTIGTVSHNKVRHDESILTNIRGPKQRSGSIAPDRVSAIHQKSQSTNNAAFGHVDHPEGNIGISTLTESMAG